MKKEIKNLKDFTKSTIENGGATFNVNTGVEPKEGIIVSEKGHEVIYDISGAINEDELEEDIANALRDYVINHAGLLADEDNFLGSWIDGDKLYLDISRVYDNPTEAVHKAIENKQLAVYVIGKDAVDIRVLNQQCGTEYQKRSARIQSIDKTIAKVKELLLS